MALQEGKQLAAGDQQSPVYRWVNVMRLLAALNWRHSCRGVELREDYGRWILPSTAISRQLKLFLEEQRSNRFINATAYAQTLLRQMATRL